MTDITYAIGVDIGGTFTDCAIISSDGRIVSGKRPTTPADRSIGFFDAIEDASQKLGRTLAEVLQRCNRLVHGTTTGTNAIVTRSGAKVGLLTTAGHADAMFIMKGTGRTAGVPADKLMDLVGSRRKPDPIVPKRLIVEVAERIDLDGDIVVPLSREAARASAQRLIERGVDAIAISLLWSFHNPVHEELVADVVHELDPDVFVSRASDLVGRLGEYERTAAAVMNAYIGPLMTRYIESIERRSKDLGYEGIVLFSQCAGGAITGEEARRSPILTVNSGPVAGVMGSVLLAHQIEEPNILTTDMGGTTFDVSLIRDYDAMVRDTALLEKYELALPMLDVESIGAGGGSIAWIDEFGRLDVGPKSAGAVPGPACYAKGGVEPTVTDADVVLGIIDPGSFLHGEFTIDVELAHKAVGELGAQLGLGVYETAAGINRIIDSKMADLLRRMSEFRGLDPRQFAMLAFGGAGPVHAAACARDAGVGHVIVPLPDIAPVWSAAGGANADIVHVRLVSRLLHLPVDPKEIAEGFAPMESRLRTALADEGFAGETVRIDRSLRMKYAMQVYDIGVPVELDVQSDQDVQTLADLFVERYEERYGQNAGFKESGIDVSAFHTRGIGVTSKVSLLRAESDGASDLEESSRPVYWAELGDFADTAVVRTAGRWGESRSFAGPLLIELPDTVIVVRPGQSALLDGRGTVVIDALASG